MTKEEILKAVRSVDGLEGMTANERLYVTGLMDEFEDCKRNDKQMATFILSCLRLD